jgi:nucleoside phosphorylase
MTRIRALSHNDYTVGWIYALPIERASARAMLDEVHCNLPVSPNDHNTYTLGSIGSHNIVVACLPNGEYGIASAATAAIQLLSSFHSIRFGLMVGIGGGVPNKDADIRLGDIVVSKPTSRYGGVVQYDYGKAINGGLEQTGTLNRPPRVLLTALAELQANHLARNSQILELLSKLTVELGQNASHFMLPDQDQLYHADYEHSMHARTCELCD